MKLLACDIGNNFVKIGLFNKNKLTKFFSERTENLTMSFLTDVKFDAVAISSVVPHATKFLENFFKKNFNITPFVINSNAKFNLQLDYETPETLGTDRICGAEGAFEIYCEKFQSNALKKNESIITIDLGTATTINVILPPNIFSGGVILPGVVMMSNLLNKNTEQLPNVSLKSYNSVIGKSTPSAIASGIVNSTIGAAARINDFLKREKGVKKIYIFLTGGNSAYFKKVISFEVYFVKDLVLRGIKSVYERNLK
ncbi:type III pantothenate kinase [Melioribacteraceae bacterium 4301-Me]|uniref:type III pantothenate kinase n=1 Tax=Pyranulibacter aquaticus TaxID=3163344 RepID=UPI00359AC4D2